jgi:hypothetical protein
MPNITIAVSNNSYSDLCLLAHGTDDVPAYIAEQMYYHLDRPGIRERLKELKASSSQASTNSSLMW